jgi:hypothetical protein
MSLIWLSPRLPADRAALAASLGRDVEISSAPLPPAGTSVAVATVYERPLLEQLASRSGGGALLLLKPPGTATPADFPAAGDRPTRVSEAADVGAAADAIRSALTEATGVWPEPTPDGGAQASSGWLLAGPQNPTGELPAAAVPAPRRNSRRAWLASGGIIGTAALAAVLVLATQGGASGTSNTGFRGPGGVAGGLPGGGFGEGATGSGSTGSGSAGSGSAGTGSTGSGATPQGGLGSTDRSAARQAFLDCLSKNGVDVSGLASGQGRPRLDPSDPTMATAFQACRSLLPERGFRDGRGPGGGEGMRPDGGMPPGGGLGIPGAPEGTGAAPAAPGGQKT